MSADFTELAINVSEYTGITDLPNHFGRLCGMAEREIFKHLRVAEMEKTIALNLTNGAGDLPEDLVEVFKVHDTADRRLDRIAAELVTPSSDQAIVVSDGFETMNAQRGFAVKARKLVVYPQYDTVKLTYYARAPGLEANGTNWLLEAEPNIYIQACAAQAYIWKQNPDAAKASKDYTRELLTELQNLDTNLRYKDQKQPNGSWGTP